jgi:beta-N-acetylhexosaminidase
VFGALIVLSGTMLSGCSQVVSGTGAASDPSHPAVPASVTPSSQPRPATPSSTRPSPSRASPSRATTTAPAATSAQRVLAAMDLPHRIGQLLMVNGSAGAVDPWAINAITSYHVGGIYLGGRTSLSIRETANVTAALQAAALGPKLLIASDQEGGEVQRFTGPGFSAIPSALVQGALPVSTLRTDATAWGAQLAAAGVNLDLAPVADTVPSPASAQSNAPIGALNRQYGYDPTTVAAHAAAFAAGLRAAGVAATAKHFPGLGRVIGNTDTSSGVTDRQTGPGDPFLAPFAALINGGVPFVMTSTAIYARLDPARPAAFSPTIIDGLLRGDLGFDGVVISDDLNGVQVRSVPAAERALQFIDAGGDIVLDLQDADVPLIATAIIDRAHTDAAFRSRVDRAALRVLTAKDRLGLLD